jgi:hypothetical protein
LYFLASTPIQIQIPQPFVEDRKQTPSKRKSKTDHTQTTTTQRDDRAEPTLGQQIDSSTHSNHPDKKEENEETLNRQQNKKGVPEYLVPELAKVRERVVITRTRTRTHTKHTQHCIT